MDLFDQKMVSKYEKGDKKGGVFIVYKILACSTWDSNDWRDGDEKILIRYSVQLIRLL